MAARCDDQNQDASGGRRSIHLNYITPTRRDKVVDEKPGLRLFICCLMQNSVNCLTIFTPVFFLRLKHCKKTKRVFLIHRISQERKETLKTNFMMSKKWRDKDLHNECHAIFD